MKKKLFYIIRGLEVCLYTSAGMVLLVAAYLLCRVFLADQFVIPSDSMYPTLQAGDRVWVNKTLMGARLYCNLDSAKSAHPKMWRTRGRRGIRRNDVVVFNFPINRGAMSFKINYVYAKRCVALPGDSIRAEEGYYRNNNYFHLLGEEGMQVALHHTPDNMVDKGVRYTLPYDYAKYPWTIRNFGPLYVPRRGDVMELDADKVRFYGRILAYETGQPITVNGRGEVLAGGEVRKHHVFCHNYYFMAGDNVQNSSDSRYWGFVPEEYVVGVVKFIPYAKNRATGALRWDRMLKII